MEVDQKESVSVEELVDVGDGLIDCEVVDGVIGVEAEVWVRSGAS